MKSSEMRKELESYGVSTKSLFDKMDFEKALTEARLKQGQKEIQDLRDRISQNEEVINSKDDKTERKTVWGRRSVDNNNKENQPNDVNTRTTPSDIREDKYKNAFQKGIEMKLSELKQELKDRGISTSAFFEKVEMAKAYAEAIADNVTKKTNNKQSTTFSTSYKQEVFDPSYQDVIVQPFHASMLLPEDKVIDVTPGRV
jgi:hypothetical protein